MKTSILYTQDGYKLSHPKMMNPRARGGFGYFESRSGAQYPYSVFFGIQAIIKEWFIGETVVKADLDKFEGQSTDYFGSSEVFRRSDWDYIIDNYRGKLPLSIRAVPEGSIIPTGNILFSVEPTDENCVWLAGAVETLLSQVWHPTTVATRSRFISQIIRSYFDKTSDAPFLAEYYLHDFSQRGISSMESAGVGSLAHLLFNFGSDSLMAIPYAEKYYGGNLKIVSVAATEHSIAGAEGKLGEFEVTKRIIEAFPNGILSIVSDTYDIENAVKVYCNELKPFILKRNGKFVVRPDSLRFLGDTPANQVAWIVQTLWNSYGGTINSKGFKALDSHVGCIYGDSLTEDQIEEILTVLQRLGFSAENCCFGCGSYLTQKINRDTQRFAFKCSAQLRDGVWHDVYKEPMDPSKASKRGRLKLIKDENGQYKTVRQEEEGEDLLRTVFHNGSLLIDETFETIRERANNQGNS